MDKRSQLRSCPDKGLSVWTPKECKPTSVHRLSELKKLAIHIYTPLHPEHVANAFTYDNKHTLQNVLHTEKFPFTFGKSRRSLRITSQFSQQTRVVLITCHVSQSGSSKESVNTLRVLVGLLSLGLFRRPGSTEEGSQVQNCLPRQNAQGFFLDSLQRRRARGVPTFNCTSVSIKSRSSALQERRIPVSHKTVPKIVYRRRICYQLHADEDVQVFAIDCCFLPRLD